MLPALMTAIYQARRYFLTRLHPLNARRFSVTITDDLAAAFCRNTDLAPVSRAVLHRKSSRFECIIGADLAGRRGGARSRDLTPWPVITSAPVLGEVGSRAPRGFRVRANLSHTAERSTSATPQRAATRTPRAAACRRLAGSRPSRASRCRARRARGRLHGHPAARCQWPVQTVMVTKMPYIGRG
jgi:hypothetical protein